MRDRKLARTLALLRATFRVASGPSISFGLTARSGLAPAGRTQMMPRPRCSMNVTLPPAHPKPNPGVSLKQGIHIVFGHRAFHERTGEHCPRTGWWFPPSRLRTRCQKRTDDSSVRARSCRRSEVIPLTGFWFETCFRHLNCRQGAKPLVGGAMPKVYVRLPLRVDRRSSADRTLKSGARPSHPT